MAEGKERRTESAAGLVPAATLCELSGLTDRRHRQLAAEGFFPPPIRGQYQLRATIAGLFRYYRELQVKRGATLAQKREKKLDNENTLLELEIAREEERLISVEEMAARLTPACAAMRTRILGSSMADGERDALLDDCGRLLDDAIKCPLNTRNDAKEEIREFHTDQPANDGEGEAVRGAGGAGAKVAGDSQAAAAAKRKPVG